jgi:type II secretory pathway pseudopilin PulG
MRKAIQKGFGLTEALIGLVILSSGLIAIYGVHSDFLRSANDSRNRDIALQLASSRLEEVRDDLADGSINPGDYSPETGLEETYDRVTTLTAVDDRYNVKIKVSWGGLFGDDSIVIGAQLKTMDPAKVISVTTNGSETTLPAVSSIIGTPQGEAEYGSGETTDTAGSNNAVENENDGTRIVEEGGLYKLVDNTTNEVLLKSSSPLKTISGRMYVNITAAGIEKSDIDALYVGAPDVSVCRNVRNTSGNSNDYYAIDPDYYYLLYQCYVGANWYGDIGIGCSQYRNNGDCGIGNTSIPQTDSNACVGDPAETANDVATNAFSREPQSSLKRSYRGYAEAQPEVVVDEANYYVIRGIDESYAGHDLYLSGSSSCETSMTTLEESEDGAFADSSGRYVCLSDSCPSDLLDVYAKEVTLNIYTWLTGSVTALYEVGDDVGVTDAQAVVSGVSAAIGDESTVCDNLFDDNQWACTVKRFGSVTGTSWNAGNWDGEISFTYEGIECDQGSDGVVTKSVSVNPTTADIVMNCNGSGSGASCLIESFDWVEVTPSPSSTLLWATSNCSGVDLRMCDEDKNNTCTPLSTDTSMSSTADGSYQGGSDLEDDDTKCFKLFADNEESQVKCIREKNGYKYVP